MGDYVLTDAAWNGHLEIHRVVSRTTKQLKTHSTWTGDKFNTNRVNTVAASKVLAEFDTEEQARAAMARAKAAWDRAAGPVGDAQRILSERRERQRREWLEAITAS
jgi:hypothetical protein